MLEIRQGLYLTDTVQNYLFPTTIKVYTISISGNTITHIFPGVRKSNIFFSFPINEQSTETKPSRLNGRQSLPRYHHFNDHAGQLRAKFRPAEASFVHQQVLLGARGLAGVLRIAISNLLQAPALLFTKPTHGIFRNMTFRMSN